MQELLELDDMLLSKRYQAFAHRMSVFPSPMEKSLTPTILILGNSSKQNT